MKGKVIVIEGLDGSGKATQAALLANSLRDKGMCVKQISFPDYAEPSSSLVKMYLNSEFGQDPNVVNAYASSSFFAVDRYASYMKFWKSEYELGQVIIADRYVTSNIVYQMCKLPKSEWDTYISWLFDYEYKKLELPEPDAVIYLDMSVQTSQDLMRERYHGDDSEKDLHEKNIDFQIQCRQASRYAISKLKWHEVCCSTEKVRAVESIGKDVLDIVNRVIRVSER